MFINIIGKYICISLENINCFTTFWALMMLLHYKTLGHNIMQISLYSWESTHYKDSRVRKVANRTASGQTYSWKSGSRYINHIKDRVKAWNSRNNLVILNIVVKCEDKTKKMYNRFLYRRPYQLGREKSPFFRKGKIKMEPMAFLTIYKDNRMLLFE